jgi:GNAT superfamily N-acetyltransferase
VVSEQGSKQEAYLGAYGIKSGDGGMNIRPGADTDATGIIALISACWAEYPGIVFDLDGEVPELRTLATHFANLGGTLWVAEAAGEIVATIAVVPTPPDGTWEIARMYTSQKARGTGLAQRLLNTAEAHARAHGAARLCLHSDSRFDRAHSFYEKSSYLRAGPVRVLHDKSNSLEFDFSKPVNGVVAMDAPAAASAERRLAEILLACVQYGASVSFMASLTLEEARDFWRTKAKEVATGTRILLAAYADGTLAGTVTLDCGMPPNQPHHAAVQKMLVHPQARRRGLARALMRAAEQAALTAGRTLLTLDTASAAAEALYRDLNYVCVGTIPRYALNPDASPCDTTLFYKHLPR